MKTNLKYLIFCVVISACSVKKNASENTTTYNEAYRPQFHFTPKAKWMNDPNGLIYLKGNYHMFFQYYPDGTVWGPMHWGHAISKDLIHWDEQAIALYPDSLGWIFSGSAVYDERNTSGLAKDGKMPLVAIFTHHNQKLEKEGRKDYQYQSLAYSLDEGKTWEKYAGNPVIKNSGIVDFRDPKVRWNEEVEKWIMTLATKDRITFYSSSNLIDWTKASEFGENIGAHGGVWECPDLFPMKVDGKEVWVLLVSINPGAPNGGSGTQYFVGDFDGKTFKPFNTKTKWIDYGTDNYAGVTFANTDRLIFLGWMSNWQYAQQVPTQKWRSAMTLPRELSLEIVDDEFLLVNKPVNELKKIIGKSKSSKNIQIADALDLTADIAEAEGKFQLKFNSATIQDYKIVLSNNYDEELIIGYNKKDNQYFIDRQNARKEIFEKGFGAVHTAPRLSRSNSTDVELLFDAASVEFFADGGLTAMTDIFFPTQPFNKLQIKSKEGMLLRTLEIASIKSIWD